MERAFKAIKVKEGYPIWDLISFTLIDGSLTEDNIGSMTDFTNEGPMATVSRNGEEVTVSGIDLKDCLVKAKDAYHSINLNYDEDGDIAYARMKEDQALDWAMQDPCWGTSQHY